MEEYDINRHTLQKKVGEIYITDKILGTGSFAQVNLGYFGTKENVCAIKEIVKEKLDEFKRKILTREIENMAMINHKNIVNLVNVSQTAAKYYICMGLCKNGTLNKYLENKERTTELILKITKDIIEGFRCLYNKSIIHRDIKPDNLLVDEDGTIRIADFGFSKTLDEKDKTSYNTSVGTPVYACSEVLKQEEYSSKCDVFSVGVLLFEAAYKHHPFFPSNPPKSMKQLIDAQDKNPAITFPESPAFSENYKNMIRGMLKPKENDRLSWPQVFDMFDKENQDIDQGKLKIHKENLECASFYDYAANSIKEVLNDSPDRVKLPLHRIRFITINLGSLALRDVLKNFKDSAEATSFPKFAQTIPEAIERSDSIYREEYKNNCLLELNQHLNLDENDPTKNNRDELVGDLLLPRIKAVLDMWTKETMEQKERVQMLLCLHMLKHYPKFPEQPKNFVEKNKNKSISDIKNIIF